MKWKVKARLQSVVSFFPPSLSHPIYYWIQRHFGGLKQVNPVNGLTVGVEVCKRIKKFGATPLGKVFLELGTGRRINTPIAYWLIGAKKVITVDINPYLKEKLVREDIDYIRAKREKIRQLFDDYFCDDRFQSLINLTNRKWHLKALLELCKIKYLTPVDSANLPISAQSVNFYTSYFVFEHIPLDKLKLILKESNRVVKAGGLFIHRIDYSDHFSHSDQSISSINFLQFSDNEWKTFTENRYVYMNRLRADDFQHIFQEAGQRILSIESDKDLAVPQLLKAGKLKLNDKFREKSEEVIATIASWIVLKKNGQQVEYEKIAFATTEGSPFLGIT